MQIGSVARKRETGFFTQIFGKHNLIYAFLWKWGFIILKGIYHEKLYFNMLSVSKHLVKKDEQHKYRVKIYTVITLSLHLTPFLYYKTIKSTFCVLVVLEIKKNLSWIN